MCSSLSVSRGSFFLLGWRVRRFGRGLRLLTRRRVVIRLAGLSLFLAAAGSGAEPFASTYVARPAGDIVFTHVNVLTGTGAFYEDVEVAISGGRISSVGEGQASAGTVIDGAGRWLTPGLIDVHSHLGDYPSPSIAATADGNEMTSPITAEVWAEHSVWPQDPQFPLALAGGVTTLQILPGSGNLIGGRGVTLKNVPSRTVQGMKFPGAPHGLKMACGENPKRFYGEQGKAPMTRMGNVAGYRKAWVQAADYKRKLEAALTDDPDKQVARDIQLETLVGVLDGEILVHNHCYRADEMAVMIDIGKEFGYSISTFHHAIEAYKIADVLAAEGICAAMWADWWGAKLEAFDGVEENIALVDKASACAIVHSDSARDIQRLNQEAAKAMAAGRRMGLAIDAARAIRWITLNPAIALGIDGETGSIEVGKAADVVLWDRNPFSVYSHADLVLIDGYPYFDRASEDRWVTDFDLQQTVQGGGR